MRKWLHAVYFGLGTVFCELCLLYWRLRDAVSKPNTDAILFVAHPDDDTLFFHSFIKERKPYVVLLFTGWSLNRLPCFFKVMRHYGVRYRAYPTVSAGAYDLPQRRKAAERHVRACFRIKRFSVCATHGKSGEYGHPTHKLVHESVVRHAQCPILVTVDENELQGNELEPELVREKVDIFRRLYVTESWVIEELPLWLNHEKLRECSERRADNRCAR